MNNYSKYGEEIKARARDNGITMEELASEIGVSRKQLWIWLCQKETYTIRKKRVEKALDRLVEKKYELLR